MTVLEERPAHLTVIKACRALGVNRSTVYAWRQRRRRHAGMPATQSVIGRGASAHARDCPYEPYRDQPVYGIYHDLLQQGVYLGSLSSWYRRLREVQESGDRRSQRIRTVTNLNTEHTLLKTTREIDVLLPFRTGSVGLYSMACVNR